jgi:hypothetical protein
MISDGTIVDGDINAAAAIAQSKIANLTTDLGLKAPLADPAFTGTATAVNLTLSGDLTVNGTTTNLNSTNLVIEDKNIVLGDTGTPTDTTADGGGITLKGASDKTFNWVDATDAWTSSEHINLASGKSVKLNGTDLKDVAETLTNKTLTSPVISTISNTGTLTLPTSTGTLALTSDITVTASSSNTLTNKSISLGSNTVTSTLAELNSAVTDADVASIAGTETLTNKTLTSPTLNDPKINLAIDAETASYTAVLANNGQIVTMNNGSANTFSIPTDASVDFPIGTQITVLQIGAGQTTIQAVTSGTTTVNSTGATANAPKLRVRYASATCVKLSANNWIVLGDIS